MKGSKKTFFRPLMVIFVIVCSLQIYASQEAFLNMIGPTNVAVGKSAVRFNFNYSFNGTMLYGHSYAYETPPFYLAENNFENQNLDLFFNAPARECLIIVEASIAYRTPYPWAYPVLSTTRNVYVQKPFLHTIRTGLDGVAYEDNSMAVPIHWNIDDDDKSGYGGGSNADYGEDYKQYEFLSNSGIDDDLYSIQASVTNADFNASGCILKIKTPDSMRLWFTQNKSALCCDSNSVYETNCNIVNWFNTHANSQGNRLYVEWVVPPNTTTNEYIEFYCNDIQFAELRYKGYAVTVGGLPNKAERAFFETNCYFLDGCEWRIAPGGGTHVHDRNSLSESIDPTWERYGEEFVATTSAPLCTNIYFLRTAMYNNFQCRCISMDSFYDQNHIFSEADATAFFTIYNFWHDNFSNLNTDPLYSDIIYYNGQFAARKINDADRVNCHSSWAMVSSRFFNRPKIVHRAEQLGPIKTIQKTYIMVPSLDPEGNSLEEE
ncbi:hypothetical protein J6U78_08915 [bacterium]|nr:hypothetical protein [bacterium]